MGVFLLLFDNFVGSSSTILSIVVLPTSHRPCAAKNVRPYSAADSTSCSILCPAERHREGLLDTQIDLGITQYLVERVNLVHVEKSNPAHIALHNVAKLQKGIARPHAKRGIPAQFADLTVQLLNVRPRGRTFCLRTLSTRTISLSFLCVNLPLIIALGLTSYKSFIIP